jgi:hypothetical protein
MQSENRTIPLPALLLGLGGLIPFLYGALIIHFPESLIASATAVFPSDFNSVQFGPWALGAYGAVILSFLGGVRWGCLLNQPERLQQWTPLVMSVVPSLIAWPALLLTPRLMMCLLIAGFVIQYMLDVNGVARGQLPVWFGRLRLLLTSIAIICLIAGLLGI